MPSKSKKTGNARYVIHIPTHDTMGAPLLDFSQSLVPLLQQRLPRMIHSMHVEGPYTHGSYGARHLHVVAHDTPEVDSHVKELATDLAQSVNHPHVTVIKDSEQGIQPWTMQNKSFAGGSAHPAALQPIPIQMPGPSNIAHVSPSGVLSSSKARRWLGADKSLPGL